MKVHVRALVCASVFLLPAGAFAQSAQASRPAAADSAFMKNAAADGMAEVALGRLGAEKATRQDLKDFAQMMVDDHTKANDELKALAAQKDVMLPTDLKPQHQAAHDRLGKLSGAAFDTAFAKQLVVDHQKAVAAFSKEASGGKDAETKAWAGGTLPKLQEHLAHARKLSANKSASAPAQP